MACTPSNIGRHRKVSLAAFDTKLAELQASHFDGSSAIGHGNGGDESSLRQAQFGSAVASNPTNNRHAGTSTLKRGLACGFQVSDERMVFYRRSRFGFFMPHKRSQLRSRIVKNRIEVSRIGYAPSPLFR
jgi:hypothetical protein